MAHPWSRKKATKNGPLGLPKPTSKAALEADLRASRETRKQRASTQQPIEEFALVEKVSIRAKAAVINEQNLVEASHELSNSNDLDSDDLECHGKNSTMEMLKTIDISKQNLGNGPDQNRPSKDHSHRMDDYDSGIERSGVALTTEASITIDPRKFYGTFFDSRKNYVGAAPKSNAKGKKLKKKWKASNQPATIKKVAQSQDSQARPAKHVPLHARKTSLVPARNKGNALSDTEDTDNDLTFEEIQARQKTRAEKAKRITNIQVAREIEMSIMGSLASSDEQVTLLADEPQPSIVLFPDQDVDASSGEMHGIKSPPLKSIIKHIGLDHDPAQHSTKTRASLRPTALNEMTIGSTASLTPGECRVGGMILQGIEPFIPWRAVNVNSADDQAQYNTTRQEGHQQRSADVPVTNTRGRSPSTSSDLIDL